MKLLGLSVFGQLFNRIIQSMNRQSECIQNYFERVIIGAKQSEGDGIY